MARFGGWLRSARNHETCQPAAHKPGEDACRHVDRTQFLQTLNPVLTALLVRPQGDTDANTPWARRDQLALDCVESDELVVPTRPWFPLPNVFHSGGGSPSPCWSLCGSLCLLLMLSMLSMRLERPGDVFFTVTPVPTLPLAKCCCGGCGGGLRRFGGVRRRPVNSPRPLWMTGY